MMDFNNKPYHDDFDKDQNYYSVLFKAGKNVQPRELNVLQSMKQYQIGALGNHLFKNGAKISGCSSSFIQYDYIRLDDVSNLISSFNTSHKIIGETSKVEATIIEGHNVTSDDDALFLVMYTKSGLNQEQTFIPGESINVYNDKNELLYTTLVKNQLLDDFPVIGKSLLFIIDEGTFFYNNYFIKVQKQSLLIERYLKKDENGSIKSDETYRIGLDIVEDIITADEDKSLLDPHFDSSNFGAPGADRYKINLYLAMRDYVDDGKNTNFILLAKVRQNHAVEYHKEDTEYNEIMKELSRRTYDTYGDFTNIPWKAHFLNEKKSNINDTKGWSLTGDENKYVAVVSPGSGYVKGYRVETKSELIARGRKAVDIGILNNLKSKVPEPKYVIVTSNTVVDWGYINPNSPNTNTYKMNMYNASNVLIGTFSAYDIYNLGSNKYQVFLYDMSLNGKGTLSDVVKIKLTNGVFEATCDAGDFDGIMSYNEHGLLIPIGVKNITGIQNLNMNLRMRFNAVLDENGSHTFTLGEHSTFVNDPYIIAWIDNGTTKENISASNITFTDTEMIINAGADKSNYNITIVTSVNRSNIAYRSKTKTLDTIEINGSTSISKSGWKRSLKSDTIKLESVKLINSVDQREIDITHEYELVKASSTNNFYGADYIKRTSFRDISSEDKIVIKYYYFNHSSSGEYFTINSYNGVDKNDIPVYNGNKATDYLDFRTDTTDNINLYFNGIPSVNSTISYDIEHYMNRADLLVIDIHGEIKIKEGTPGLIAKLPKPDEDSMPLYGIFLDALGNIENTKIEYYDNRSYTSKDINRLKSRIGNIEDAVTLSLLEQKTLNMSIKDQNGFDRYKNGILVDNFKTFSAADINNEEFKAAIDTNKGILRPQFKMNNIRLAFDQLNSQNLLVKGNMAIKKYENDLFIQNVFATQSVSINPYLIFCKTGTMALSPNIDTWSDTEKLPTIVMNVDTGLDALTKVADAAKITGTKYGTWADINTSIATDTKTVIKSDPPIVTNTKIFSGDDDNVVSFNRETTKTKVTTEVETIKTTTVQSARDVSVTRVSPNMQSYDINDMVKEVSIIPYIRSRTIQFYASNLKPNTRVYAFFDGEDVNINCRAITQIDGEDVIRNRSSSVFGSSQLIVGNDGTLMGEFRIPANRFFAGEKVFVLTDDPTNSGNPDVETTRCQSVYFAGGVSQTKQNVHMNVITSTYGTTVNSESKTSTSTSRSLSVSSKVLEENRDYEEGIDPEDLKKYFFDNHPNLKLECSFMETGAGFGGITWGFSNTNTNVEINIVRLQAIKERVDLNESNAARFIANNRSAVEKEWANYNKLLDYKGVIDEPYAARSSKIFKQIKELFASKTSKCEKFYNDYLNSRDYKDYLENYDVQSFNALVNRLDNDLARGVGSSLNWGTRRWNAPPRAVVFSRDPVAQGFKVDESCFISKVEVFFESVDDKTDVIWFEIREMVNGYPSDEGISRREIRGADLKRFESTDGSVPYPVEFEIPVYVDASKSYAFVIGGHSPDTRIYISKLGNKLLNSDSILEQPPLNYTMFRSLNGETWNAEQFDTMKINIYRCVFDMSPSTIAFHNTTDEPFELPCDSNPIEIQKGNNRVRIYAKNHGLRINDRVIINFSKDVYYQLNVTNNMVPQIGQPISTVSGSGYIKDVKITPTLNVYDVSIDRMNGVFKVGEEFVCETRQYQYRDLFLASDRGSVDVPVTLKTVLGNVVGVSSDIPESINGAEISLFTKEHIVRDVDNIDSFVIEIESPFISSGRFGNDNINIYGSNIKYDLFNVAGQYLTYNSNESWNLIAQQYNNEEITEVPFLPMHDVSLEEPNVILSVKNESRIMGKGKYSFNINGSFKTNNPYISPVFNTDSFSVTTVSNRIDYIDEVSYNVAPNGEGRYISETAPIDGIQPFKYVTNKISLENAASDVKVMFDIHLPNGTDFDVYVKLNKTGDARADDKVNWIKFDNYQKQNTGNKSDNYMSYDLILSKHCSEWNANIEFISLRVKLVGRSSNSSSPVLFKNLRVIAVT